MGSTVPLHGSEMIRLCFELNYSKDALRESTNDGKAVTKVGWHGMVVASNLGFDIYAVVLKGSHCLAKSIPNRNWNSSNYFE